MFVVRFMKSSTNKYLDENFYTKTLICNIHLKNNFKLYIKTEGNKIFKIKRTKKIIILTYNKMLRFGEFMYIFFLHEEKCNFLFAKICHFDVFTFFIIFTNVKYL